jgi:hypothetical protein
VGNQRLKKQVLFALFSTALRGLSRANDFSETKLFMLILGVGVKGALFQILPKQGVLKYN